MSNNNYQYYKNDFFATLNIVIEYYKFEDRTIADKIAIHKNLPEDIFIKVLDYCKDQNVKVINFDDMKITYFLGIELYKLSKDDKYMLTMLNILNKLVYLETAHFIDKDIFIKIRSSVINDKWQNFYGIYGIYTIFKNCYKIGSEKKE
ncbi:MAG: hypothetical protein WC656_01295 [Sulfurimonas sp.]|jgi:hypothetical protein